MHTLSASFGSHITCQPEGPGDERVKIKTIHATAGSSDWGMQSQEPTVVTQLDTQLQWV